MEPRAWPVSTDFNIDKKRLRLWFCFWLGDLALLFYLNAMWKERKMFHDCHFIRISRPMFAFSPIKWAISLSINYIFLHFKFWMDFHISILSVNEPQYRILWIAFYFLYFLPLCNGQGADFVVVTWTLPHAESSIKTKLLNLKCN